MSQTERREHWEGVYRDKPTDRLTWYQERPTISLELIDQAVAATEGEGKHRVIDVGAGASTLEDHLVERSDVELTAVDIAPAALERMRERIGPEAAEQVDWVVADLTEPLGDVGPFDVWHDRAVFHFLTDPDDRRAYRQNLERVVGPGGHAVISTFSLEGPETCSGLPVRQYSPETLAEELGDGWRLLESRREDHPTPWDGTQNFIYGLFVRQ
jgi:SAM-dependent methyltransferase